MGRRVLVLFVLLGACGQPVWPTPTVDTAATQTRTTRLAERATLTAATATPAPSATRGATPAPPPTATVVPAPPTPVPAPAQLVTLQGSGARALDPLPLSAGLLLLSTTHRGRSNFIVQLLDSQERLVALVTNHIGPYTGYQAVRVPRAGQYVFTVEAEGSWAITAMQPGPAEFAAALALPQVFTLTGRDYTPFFRASGDTVRIKANYTGDARFSVRLLDAEGQLVALVVDVFGPHSGVTVDRVPGPGVYLLDVEADSPWRLEVSP